MAIADLADRLELLTVLGQQLHEQVAALLAEIRDRKEVILALLKQLGHGLDLRAAQTVADPIDLTTLRVILGPWVAQELLDGGLLQGPPADVLGRGDLGADLGFELQTRVVQLHAEDGGLGRQELVRWPCEDEVCGDAIGCGVSHRDLSWDLRYYRSTSTLDDLVILAYKSNKVNTNFVRLKLMRYTGREEKEFRLWRVLHHVSSVGL